MVVFTGFHQKWSHHEFVIQSKSYLYLPGCFLIQVSNALHESIWIGYITLSIPEEKEKV